MVATAVAMRVDMNPRKEEVVEVEATIQSGVVSPMNGARRFVHRGTSSVSPGVRRRRAPRHVALAAAAATVAG